MDSNEFGFDDEAPTMQAAASAMVQELESSNEEQVTNEAYMEDVDRRLDVASTYRQLLRAPIFDQATESTIIVENELREFVVQRLKILLNMAPAPMATVQPVVQQLPFDEQELKTLKVLLATLADRAGKKVVPKGPPQIAKVTVPAPLPTPTVRKAVTVSLPGLTPKTPTQLTVANKAPPVAKPDEPELKEMEDPRSGQTILTRRPKRQIRPRNAIPMPTGAEMEAILHAQAMGSGAAVGGIATQDSVTSINALGSQLIANALKE